mgnify:CR=1 FL=1
MKIPLKLPPPIKLCICRLNQAAILPTRAHLGDAGLDLYGIENISIAPGESCVIRTGIALEIPEGHVGMIADRSSLAKKGLKTVGGIIDSGYRGEIQILVWNLAPKGVLDQTIKLRAGDRVAQLLILPIAQPPLIEVQSLASTPRGEGGFGSTGA